MLRTFNEWSDAGYKIKKGSKATWVDGVPMFSKEQVEIYTRPYEYWRSRKHSYGLDHDVDYDDPMTFDNWMGKH